MVSLRSYLSPSHVVLDLDGRSKADLLQRAGTHLAPLLSGLDATEITGLLAARVTRRARCHACQAGELAGRHIGWQLRT